MIFPNQEVELYHALISMSIIIIFILFIDALISYMVYLTDRGYKKYLCPVQKIEFFSP
jgi:hypothetical protein